MSLIAASVAGIVSMSAQAELPVIVVEGEQESFSITLENKNTVAPDSTELLRGMAGAAVVKNGPLTGFAQYRGMFGQRINTVIDGAALTAGGPNWMDAPLHYAPTSQVESIRVYRGLSPVSSGQETIGGSVIVETKQGEFTDSEDFGVSGAVSVGGQSNNRSASTSGVFSIANKSHWLTTKLLDESGDDQGFEDGDITPTEYQRSRYDVSYGFQSEQHEIILSGGRNETGESGTPALPMDIRYVDTNLYSAQYLYHGDDSTIKVHVFGNEVEHEMTNYHLRVPPMMAMKHRTALATGDSQGAKLSYKSEGKLDFLVGLDVHSSVHSTDITNPNNDAFLVENFDEATRDVVGVFAESVFSISESVTLDAGVRLNQVSMDSEDVNVIDMMGLVALKDDFNGLDRSQEDQLLDIVTTLTYEASDDLSLYVGVSRKNRAPSYQERYLWAPMESTGGLADGNTYIGDVDLEPELSYESNAGFDLAAGDFDVSPRIFYRHVEDYIQGVEASNMAALMANNMMNPDKALLQFTNVEARFYGFDVNWGYAMDSAWSLRGVVNYVRGERRDVEDSLYRISPPNTLYAVDYAAEDWGFSIENHLFAKQKNVSDASNEQQTEGYGLVNVSAYAVVNEDVTLTAGVDNLTDKKYQDHLAGYNRATNDVIAKGERLPGVGRNIYVQASMSF